MRKLLSTLIVLLVLVGAAYPQRRTTDANTITASGGSVTFNNDIGGMMMTFEEKIAGAPATVSIVISGCMRGGTCETLDTYATVANANRSPTLTKVYDLFTVTASWTGGTSPSITINTTTTTSRLGSSGGGSSFTGGNVANPIGIIDGTTAVPSLYRTASPNTGLLFSPGGFGGIALTDNAVAQFYIHGASNTHRVSSSTYICWSSGDPTTAACDTGLYRSASGTVSAGSGSTAGTPSTFAATNIALTAGGYVGSADTGSPRINFSANKLTFTKPIVLDGSLPTGILKQATSTGVVSSVSTVRTLGWSYGDVATGSALTTSEVGYITVPFACTITGWRIMADAGTVTIKTARVATGGTALPTLGSNSISTSGVALSTGTLINSTTVTDFTSTAVTAGDTLGFFITTVATAKQITFQLDCEQ